MADRLMRYLSRERFSWLDLVFVLVVVSTAEAFQEQYHWVLWAVLPVLFVCGALWGVAGRLFRRRRA